MPIRAPPFVGSSSLPRSAVFPRADCPHDRAGRSAGGQTGVSQRVPVGFLAKSTRRPPRHRISLRLAARLLRLPASRGRRVIALGVNGRPARILFLWPPLSFSAMLQQGQRTACRREQQRPGRRQEPWRRSLVSVDPTRATCREMAARLQVPGLVRAGRPRLAVGSLHPMTRRHQGHQIAEAFWCRLWLKQVYLSSGLFVFIRVHWWFVFINDQPFFLE